MRRRRRAGGLRPDADGLYRIQGPNGTLEYRSKTGAAAALRKIAKYANRPIAFWQPAWVKKLRPASLAAWLRCTQDLPHIPHELRWGHVREAFYQHGSCCELCDQHLGQRPQDADFRLGRRTPLIPGGRNGLENLAILCPTCSDVGLDQDAPRGAVGQLPRSTPREQQDGLR